MSEVVPDDGRRAPRPGLRLALGGLRTRLVLLALAIMIPVFLFAGSVTLRYVEGEQDAIRARGIELARLAAEDVDQEIAVARGILIGLSTSHALQQGDMEAVYRQAQAVARWHGKPVGFIDRDGNRRFVTFRPYGDPLPPHPAADLVRQALESGRPQVSNLITSPARGARALLVLEPAFVHDVVVGVFGIELDMARIVTRIVETKLPEGWLVAVLDRNRTIVARSRAAEQYVGTPATADLQSLIATVPTGTAEAHTKEGGPVFTAYTRVPSAGWTVVVGVPNSIVHQPLQQRLRELAVIGTLLTALAVAAALLVARGISRPMRTLAEAARDLGQGRPVRPVPRGPEEVERVGGALRQAGLDLAERARERDDAEAERSATERRIQELQLELMHASRLSAMGAVGSAIAHELNQPLAAIANHLEVGRLLGEESGCRPELMDSLVLALEQTERAGKVIRNIRAFAAKRAVGFRAEDVAVLIDDACAIALVDTRNAGIRVTREVEPGCPPVLADRVQVQQVLVNLMRNAVEAMAGAQRRHLAIHAVHRVVTGMVEFSVADSGEGLEPELIGTLFSPFLTTKPGGLGVGLSISRTIVEAHGGWILAQPDPQQGAVFTFAIPVAPREEDHAV